MQTREHTDYGGLDELINVELAMPGYNESIVNKFARALEGRTKVLDFGAGIGTLSDIFYQKTGRLPLCVEIDQKGRSHLRNADFRFSKIFQTWARKSMESSVPMSWSTLRMTVPY